MTKDSSETILEKVRAIFEEHVGTAADRRAQLTEEALRAGVARAFPDLGADQAANLAFHLSDWRSDGAFLVALSLAPERFTPDEVAEGVMTFLIHAPNHIAAAAKLGGFPVSDIFEVGGQMIEFLVKRTDGDWFDLPVGANAYRPKTVPYEPVGTDENAIQIGGCEVSFSYEDPGIQISFHGDIAEDLAERVASEVLERIREITGQQGELIRIT